MDTEVFQLDHSLVLNPYKLRRVYGVTILIDQEGKDRQQLRFEMEVLAQKDKVSKNWLYQFNRRNVFINRKMPTGIAEKLAYECGQVMYPLQIEVSGDASKKIIKSRATAISQLKVLEEKTNRTQKSAIVDSYFKKARDTVHDSFKFGKAVEQNLFLSFFFAPIYGRYNVLSNKRQDTMDIPMIPFCSAVQYDVEQKVKSEYTPFNTITVLQEGKISDQRTEKDFLHQLDMPVFVGKEQSKKTEGQLTAKYELDIATRVIQSINAKISMQLPENQGRSFEFQAYYLPERNKLITNNTIVDQPLKEHQDEQ